MQLVQLGMSIVSGKKYISCELDKYIVPKNVKNSDKVSFSDFFYKFRGSFKKVFPNNKLFV